MDHPQWIIKYGYGYRNRSMRIVRWSDHSEIAKVTSDIDARLIAAAPELLKALQKIAEVSEEEQIRDLARAAIAEAE